MGMYDTIYGKIRCEYCNEEHNFEEQTKSYDCMMENYTLGDYIDKGNETYVYPFEMFCNKALSEQNEVKKFYRQYNYCKRSNCGIC